MLSKAILKNQETSVYQYGIQLLEKAVTSIRWITDLEIYRVQSYTILY